MLTAVGAFESAISSAPAQACWHCDQTHTLAERIALAQMACRGHSNLKLRSDQYRLVSRAVRFSWGRFCVRQGECWTSDQGLNRIIYQRGVTMSTTEDIALAAIAAIIDDQQHHTEANFKGRR